MSNTATVSATSTDNAPANNTPPAVVTQVGCADTVTGLYAGDLVLSGSGTTCLRDVTVTGKLSVVKGATLVAVDAVVGGAMSASRSGPITVCGSTLRSSVNVDGVTGFVLFGDPPDGCAANTVTGSVGFTGYLADIEVRSNTMLAANVVSGRFGCKGNDPPPVNGGRRTSPPTRRAARRAVTPGQYTSSWE